MLVRITGDKGNGKYEGTVAGAKIILNTKGSAAGKLAVGSTFVATVSLEKNQVQIIPKNLPVQFGAENQITMELANQQALFSFLEAIGLPAEEVSYHLLQQFKQLSMKLDPGLLQKIRNTAVKFKEKEKSAAEILALLYKKGIAGSEEDLLDLLEELDGDFDQQRNGQSKKSFDLMNKINGVKGAWYLFPYEIINKNQMDKDQKEITGTGSIRMFMDEGQKIRLVNLLCNYNDKKYLFSLNYENEKIDKLKMNISPFKITDIEEKTKELELHFKKLGKEVEVIWCDSSEIEGSACASEDFFVVDGQV